MEDEDYQEESAGVVVFENETNGGTISIFDELKIALPVYLENLLIRSGFDSLETVKLINREVVDEVEEFARNDLPSTIDLTNEKILKTYYGPYCTSIPDFKILIAHKCLLLARLPKAIQRYQRLQNAKKRWLADPTGVENKKRFSLQNTNFEEKSLAACNNWIKQYVDSPDKFVTKVKISFHEETNMLHRVKITCPFCEVEISLSVVDCRVANSNFVRHCLKMHFSRSTTEDTPIKTERNSIVLKDENSFENLDEEEQMVTIAKIEDYDDEGTILEEGAIEGQEEHLEEYFEETTMAEDEYLDENEQEIGQEDEEMDQKEMETVKVAQRLEANSSAYRPMPKMIPKPHKPFRRDITHQERVLNACNTWLDQNITTDLQVTTTVPTLDPYNDQRLLKQKVICPFCEAVISLSVSNFRYAVTSNFKRHILKVHVNTPKPVPSKDKLTPNIKTMANTNAPKRIMWVDGNPVVETKIIQLSPNLVIRKKI